MSKFRGVKTDNANVSAKKELREIALTLHKSPRVLEVFCGEGEMYRSVWHKSKFYTGIDKRKFFDDRTTICGDALKAMQLIDVNDFNIIDIDAYGSPYEIMANVAKNFNGDELTLVITDGTNMDLRMGRVSDGLRELSGIKNHILKRAHNLHDYLIMQALKNISKQINLPLAKKRIAYGVTGSAMRYYLAHFSDVAESA